MSSHAADRVLLEDLQVDCIIGVLPGERIRPQRLSISLWAQLPLVKAAASDAVSDTLDCALVARKVLQLAVAGQYQLLEALGGAICDYLLEDPRVELAGVHIRKPAAVAAAGAAAVRMQRARQ